MEINELHEHAEHAHQSGEKALGLTTAVVAVLLALVTLLSHRAQTDAMLALTRDVDDWNFYQSKHARAYMFALAAETQALFPSGRDAAAKNVRKSVEEECGAPVPKGCTSPLLKESAVLQQLLPGNQGTAGEKPEKTGPQAAESPSTAPAAHDSEKKSEKGGKEAGTKEGAVQIQEKAKERMDEVDLLERKIDRYDGGELFLEISIVLCSIALLAENKLYWKLSFATTAIGIATAIWGLLLR